MIMATLILIPLALGLILVLTANSLSEEHNTLRFFLFLSGIASVFLSLYFSLSIVDTLFQLPTFEETIANITYYVGTYFSVVVIYFMIYFMWKYFKTAAEQKVERLDY